MSDSKYYLKRVAPEHRNPKFMKWLEANLSLADNIANLLNELDTAFELGNAVGTQLDVTGNIVGRERQLNFEPPLGISPVLDDPIYTLLQKAKISLNQWDGTLPAAYAMLEEWFPDYDFILYDNQDMSINFYIFGEPSILEREFIARGYITPKPEGVMINYEFILPDIEVVDTVYIGGAVTADTHYVNIPQRTIGNMGFEITVKQNYSVIWWDIGYITIPTEIKVQEE